MITEEERKLIEGIEKDLRFKRFYSILRISVAIGLVLCILWFCWVNYSYAKDINELRKEHGSLWSCYVCGYDNLRRCNCFYGTEITNKVREDIANLNIVECKKKSDDLFLELR